MKLLKVVLVLCLLSQLMGCWYSMKKGEYLWITFNDSKLHPAFLENYIDSVRNKNLIIPDTILDKFLRGGTLDEQERLIHFDNPDDWYMVVFDSSPGWIALIYNQNLSDEAINEREKISESEIERIEHRYRTEILNSAEKYGKNHHLPDSVIYNLKYH